MSKEIIGYGKASTNGKILHAIVEEITGEGNNSIITEHSLCDKRLDDMVLLYDNRPQNVRCKACLEHGLLKAKLPKKPDIPDKKPEEKKEPDEKLEPVKKKAPVKKKPVKKKAPAKKATVKKKAAPKKKPVAKKAPVKKKPVKKKATIKKKPVAKKKPVKKKTPAKKASIKKKPIKKEPIKKKEPVKKESASKKRKITRREVPVKEMKKKQELEKEIKQDKFVDPKDERKILNSAITKSGITDRGIGLTALGLGKAWEALKPDQKWKFDLDHKTLLAQIVHVPTDITMFEGLFPGIAALAVMYLNNSLKAKWEEGETPPPDFIHEVKDKVRSAYFTFGTNPPMVLIDQGEDVKERVLVKKRKISRRDRADRDERRKITRRDRSLDGAIDISKIRRVNTPGYLFLKLIQERPTSLRELVQVISEKFEITAKDALRKINGTIKKAARQKEHPIQMIFGKDKMDDQYYLVPPTEE